MDIRADSIKPWLDICTSVLTIVGAFVAAAWGLNEYFNKRKEGRIKATLEYRQELNKDPVLSAQRKIDDILTSQKNLILETISNKSEDDWTKLVYSIVESNNLQQPLDTLVNFYEDVYLCISNSICDEQTAIALFGNKVIAFRNQFYRYFIFTRAEMKDPGYASGLEALAKLAKLSRAAPNSLSRNSREARAP